MECPDTLLLYYPTCILRNESGNRRYIIHKFFFTIVLIYSITTLSLKLFKVKVLEDKEDHPQSILNFS